MVRVASGHVRVIAVGSGELSHEFSVTWEESLALHNSSDGEVVSGGADHLVVVASHLLFVGGSELFDVANLSDGSNVFPVEVSSGWLFKVAFVAALSGFPVTDHLFKLVGRDTFLNELFLSPRSELVQKRVVGLEFGLGFDVANLSVEIEDGGVAWHGHGGDWLGRGAQVNDVAAGLFEVGGLSDSSSGESECGFHVKEGFLFVKF